MITLSDLFNPSMQPALSEHRLRVAYANVFSGKGNPTEEDKNLVLVDLAVESGYLSVTPDEISNERLQRTEGGRKVFGRILRMTTLTPKENAKLLDAVTRELTANDGDL